MLYRKSAPADLLQKQAEQGATQEGLLAAFMLQKQPETAAGRPAGDGA
jgi:hypothetical protein